MHHPLPSCSTLTRRFVVAAACLVTPSVAWSQSVGALAWGDNAYGQCTIPEAARGGVTAVSAGAAHAVALKAGVVHAWGSNDFGQCNVPSEASSGVNTVAAGWYHTLGVKNGVVLA